MINPKTLATGQRFKRTGQRPTLEWEEREYLIAMVGRKGEKPLYALIDLKEGNRWVEPSLKIGDVFGIYADEFTPVKN